jgi:hypothetical protein
VHNTWSKQASKTIVVVRDPTQDRRPIRFLRSAQHDCLIDIDSLVTSTCSLELVRLLPGDCSWDCTTNINLHQIPIDYIEHTHEMSRVNEPPVLLALVPPQGTHCYLFLGMLFYCLLLLRVVMHTCTYL